MMDWDKYVIADFDAGFLTWKGRVEEMNSTSKAFNTRHAGNLVKRLDAYGYVTISIEKRCYKIHRILWEMANGPIPKGMQIDHIDRNRSNNAMGNLRLATPAENKRNSTMRYDNTSGVKGVYYDKVNDKWRPYLNHQGARIFFGRHITIEDAIAARKAAELKYHGEFAANNLLATHPSRKGTKKS